jgi:hypothetical protein
VSPFIGNYARYLEEINIKKTSCYCITAYLNWVLKKSTYLNKYYTVHGEIPHSEISGSTVLFMYKVTNSSMFVSYTVHRAWFYPSMNRTERNIYCSPRHSLIQRYRLIVYLVSYSVKISFVTVLLILPGLKRNGIIRKKRIIRENVHIFAKFRFTLVIFVTFQAVFSRKAKKSTKFSWKNEHANSRFNPYPETDISYTTYEY